MKKLIKFTVSNEVPGMEYDGSNWAAIHDFVGSQNFNYSFGQLYIKAKQGHLILVEAGQTVIKLDKDHFEILSDDSQVEVLEAPFEEPEDEKVEGDE